MIQQNVTVYTKIFIQTPISVILHLPIQRKQHSTNKPITEKFTLSLLN